jgi:hypothetical protein
LGRADRLAVQALNKVRTGNGHSTGHPKKAQPRKSKGSIHLSERWKGAKHTQMGVLGPRPMRCIDCLCFWGPLETQPPPASVRPLALGPFSCDRKNERGRQLRRGRKRDCGSDCQLENGQSEADIGGMSESHHRSVNAARFMTAASTGARNEQV